MALSLQDAYGRSISYLRISLTDRCNFRCVYCMSESMQFLPRRDLLSFEEIVTVVKTLIPAGLRKVRLTGGEPLQRRDIGDLVQALAALPGLQELAMTTNGSHLARWAEPLHRAGLNSINISLDSLQAERFHHLTRSGRLADVLAGIAAAAALPWARRRLNALILRDRNDDEIVALAAFAEEQGFDMAYIEEMPLGQIQEHDRSLQQVASAEILATLEHAWGKLTPLAWGSGGPARYFQRPGARQRIGLISPHSHNFCADCNRVRLTAEGRLLLCLGQEDALDLRAVLRQQGEAAVLPAVQQALQRKPFGHTFDLEQPVQIRRYMNMTGG